MDDLYQNGNHFKALLNQEGLRLTIQRQKILNLFSLSGEGLHLSADEIYQRLVAQGEAISPSTIYRALHVMVGLGLLRELELSEGKKYYEINMPYSDQHHHLVCVQCGEVLEFSEDAMAQIGSVQTRMRGFTLLDCQFTVYGICSRCQGTDIA